MNPTTKQKFKVDFVIVDKELTPLLSGKAAQKMNLITVNYDKFKVVNAVSSPEHVQLFPDTLKDTPGKKVHLTTVEDASPAIRSARTLPESRKYLVKAELQRLVDTGMIVPVNEPTDWVSQMSVAEKKSIWTLSLVPSPIWSHGYQRDLPEKSPPGTGGSRGCPLHCGQCIHVGPHT